MYVDLQLSSDHDVLYRVNVWFYSLLKLVSCILLSLITGLLIRWEEATQLVSIFIHFPRAEYFYVPAIARIMK